MPSYSALSTACLAAVSLMPHAAATDVYRHEHAQLTHQINQDGLVHYDAPWGIMGGPTFTAIDLKLDKEYDLTAAGKAAVCTNATIIPARTTKFELNKCVITKPDPSCVPETKYDEKCAVKASMYLMGYNGDPHIVAQKTWFFNNASGPLQPACVDQDSRPGGVPWYGRSPLGTLGVRGCTVDESIHMSHGTLYNQCQWDMRGEIDQGSRCVRMAEQSFQGRSKCRGANPLSKLAESMCRTNQHKPCGCFTGVSWSTSATSV